MKDTAEVLTELDLSQTNSKLLAIVANVRGATEACQFDEIDYLLRKLASSGRQIIGFDLCEVSPGESSGEWDGNVGARVLYRLCNLSAASQKKILFND